MQKQQLKRFYSFNATVKNLIKSGRIEVDHSHQTAINYLNKLEESLNASNSYFRTPLKGAYIYGSVGSGKTMLMDLFYENVAISRKSRFHYNQFMLNFHSELGRLRAEGRKDPVKDLIDKLCGDIRLLCLDEFQVTDIADAMILRKLLKSFIDCGMTIVTTSNRHPNELYLNGIQRSIFIPCIELIKSSLEVINLSSEKDFRERAAAASGSSCRLFTNSTDSIDRLFHQMCPEANPLELKVFSRSIKIPSGQLGNCAKFTFKELFEESKSAADFIEIAKSFPKIFVTEIPEIVFSMRNEIRRFITFIDQVYEFKNELFLQSERDLINNLISLKTEIPADFDESFALSRTISRLKEILNK